MTEAAGGLQLFAQHLARQPPLVRARALNRALTKGRAQLGGLWGSSVALAAGLLVQDRASGVLLAPTAEAADALVMDLALLYPDLHVSLLPVEEEGLPEGPELAANRSERLVALASRQPDALGTGRATGAHLLVVPGPVLLEELPGDDGRELLLRCGQSLDREQLLADFVEGGLARVALVAAPGEFSLRGDILDIYPWAAEHPVRAELDDEEVSELRRFEVDTQRSVEVLQQIRLPLGGSPSDGSGARRLVDLLAPDELVLIVDPPKLKDRLAEVAFEHDIAPRRIKSALDALATHPGADLYELDLGEDETDLSIASVGGDWRPEDAVLTEWHSQGRDVLVLSDTDAENERLAELLTERGLAPDALPELRVGRLGCGFAFPEGGPVLVHHHELIGRRAVRRSRPRRVIASRAIDNLAELHTGDYVVHLTHGVARYRGMERLAREQGEEDFLTLEFADETTMYVPASRIDLVERFIGGEASGPKLDKIGGRTWKRRKDKVTRAVADVASELLALQSARSGGQGFAFPPDDPLQSRFEAAFPYEDTPDQITSWRDIRQDMEKERPMDRLLVGDVGFGKTEVAVRACFKAVLAGKQVAVLVPTTILAEQHYEVFGNRMAEEPVRIEVLSRFRGAAAQKEVLADLKAGKVDIVIGTHRLLGKDVRFPDLGLLVIDEEQRFGVTHKERLKQLRASVDVLTLSATPIPRTLHMAMSGLRDIASIQTPPPGRRAVITKVGYDEDALLRKAILHEVGRGGQVFVLHNRVQTIGRMHDRVAALVPTARLAVAHGQMGSRELQDVIERFTNGEIDVLICTTIIESGIDIPRANTILVTDSHRFGLADLHQLRGRVGRENVQAYAHFLVPRERLPGDARRRLKAIEEYTSLGSGLPIALRDLELRGAGNLLGAEQSGHIMTVGYDMYCRLLRAAVARAKGRRVEEEPGEIEVELGLTAFLPTEYVPDESVRMSLLRRLADAGARKIDQIEAELADRFGAPPPAAQELLDLFRLRRRVRLAGLTSLLADGFGGCVLTIGDEDLWNEQSPFTERELTPVSQGRWRLAWPNAVQTPEQRLGYLASRFTRQAAAVSTR
jgi:transcription-repair coupling factor (superfamily II helicase)